MSSFRVCCSRVARGYCRSYQPAELVIRGGIAVFSGAIISLMVAVGAAVLGFGGLPDATAAIFAQHVFRIAIGFFVVSALVVILDLELPRIGSLILRSRLSKTGFHRHGTGRVRINRAIL